MWFTPCSPGTWITWCHVAQKHDAALTILGNIVLDQSWSHNSDRDITKVNVHSQVKTVNFRTFTFSLPNMLSRFLFSLHQIFKMTSLHSDACPKSLPPLIDGFINDGLTEVWPLLNQTLFQLTNVAYALLIHPVLKTAPNFVVNTVKIRAVRWPNVGQD